MMLSLAAISTYLPISKIIKTSLFAKVQISKYFIVGGSKIGSCQNAKLEHHYYNYLARTILLASR